MSLTVGTRLGPYEVAAQIGAGGMGEVYKATDTRLDRTVAVKVLPEHVASDPALKQRFEREAKTLAALSHPHICPIHDVGSQDGIDFLVMEYLEGETLEQRLRKGALPLAQALQVGIQIADALSAAHRTGIVHRDLKPGNVMLMTSGAKLLDFGLAKAGALAAAGSLSMLPTTPPGQTQPGTILGTFQYMAPEQLEGKEADARTDIFAFGAVLYEMVTGRKAFEGQTQASVIAKILEVDPPPMSALEPIVPPQLERVAKKCLAKEPARRWQATSDLHDELNWIREGGPQAAAVAEAKPPAPLWRRALPVLLTGLATAVLAAGVAIWNRPPPVPRPVSRTVITLSQGERLAGLDAPAVALSPDGTQLVYVASDSAGTQRVYLRPIDALEARPLAGTEGASGPFFSPDGQWIGFFSANTLHKVSIKGGATLTLSDAGLLRGASWGLQDSIVFSPNNTSGLWQVPAAGGAGQPWTTLKEGEISHRWPQLLPGGQAILFTIGGTTSPDDWDIAVQRLDPARRDERKVLIRGGTYGRYVPTGHLIYYRAGTIMAVPFDLAQLEVTGTPAPVLEGVMSSVLNTGAGQFGFSSLGSLVYVAGSGQGRADLTLAWVDRKGVTRPLSAPPRPYGSAMLSPDGRLAAVAIGNDIWIYDLARDTLTRLSFEGVNTGSSPRWTPDGKRIVYSSDRNGARSVFWKLADGSGPEELLFTSADPRAAELTPDGRTFVYADNSKTDVDIWMLSLDSNPRQAGAQARKPQPFLQTPFVETTPHLSPDGRWLAYVSNESGRMEIYVRPFPGPGGKWQISVDGGQGLAWSPKGNEIFYRTGTSAEKMMAVEIQTQPTFSAGKPRLLFEIPRAAVSPRAALGADYSVAPDGQRFLMIRAEEEQGATQLQQINVTLNWSEELKRLVPTP